MIGATYQVQSPGLPGALYLCAAGVCLESCSSVWRHIVLLHCSLLDPKQVCDNCCSVKATPDSPPVRFNPVCMAIPFWQPFVITRHRSWLFTFPNIPAGTTAVLMYPSVSTNVPSELHLANSVFRLHVFGATLWDPHGRDVRLLRFNRGRAQLNVVIGLRCL
jgi:hypothetical protein